MSKRKGTATSSKNKKKPKANECDAGLVRLPSPGQGARANDPMPGFVQLKEKYLLTNAYMFLVEHAVADAPPPVSPTKRPKKKTFTTIEKATKKGTPSSSSSDPPPSSSSTDPPPPPLPPLETTAVDGDDGDLLFSAWIDTNRVHLPQPHHFRFAAGEEVKENLAGLIRPIKVKHAEGVRRAFVENGNKYDPARPVGTAGDNNVHDDDTDDVAEDDDDADDDAD